MKSHFALLSALAVRVLGEQVPIASQQQCLSDCTQNALGFAYAYGYPLYAYGIYVKTKYSDATTNTLYHSRTLAGPNDTAVVRPNSDTIYSTMFVDLSENDVEIEVPEFEGRYWVWPVYDMYANNLANIGSITKSPPGKYLMRYDQTNPGVQTSYVKGGYEAYLNLPTPYGIVITRILVDSSTGDLAIANDLQDQLNVTIIPRFGTPVAPLLNLSTFTDPYYEPNTEVSVAEVVLRLTAALAPYNEPYVPQDRIWVAQLLHNAGIDSSNDTFTQPPDTNLTSATAAANASVIALNTQPGMRPALGNNWTASNPQIIGAYGSFYQARYSTAVRGYLALTSEQVVYPRFDDFNISDKQAVLFQFSAKPKIKEGGFWSLTVYNEQQYLVENRLDRWAIGDRSSLTFADGTSLSGSEDGPFEILIQPNDVSPPQNWTNNWLPAQNGGGAMTITLRFYGAEDAMTNGSYIYPKVSVIDAIRE